MEKVDQEPATMTPEEAATAQDWKCLDGATAWHLIDRHADGWGDIALMMDAWARANYAPQVAQPLTDERAHELAASYDVPVSVIVGIYNSAHAIGQERAE